MRKLCKLAAAGQCDISWSTSRCSSDILVLPIFAAAHFGPLSLLPSGYTAAKLGKRAAHLALTPEDKGLRFQNLWNAIAIDQVPRVQSIRQATLCRDSYGRLSGDAVVRRLVGQSYYGRCDPVNVMSDNFKSSQKRYTMWIEIGCKKCGKK
jgi:hypothetical protein